MKKVLLLFFSMLLIVASCSEEPMNDKVIAGMDDPINPVSFDYKMYVIDNSEFEALKNPGPVKGGEFLGTFPETVICNEIIYELTAGQSIDAGDLVVSNDKDNLYVTYRSTGGWKIEEMIPVNKQSVPVPGQFSVKVSFNPPVEMVIFQISLDDVPECPVILAHATVVKDDVKSETAWGHGTNSFE